MSEAGTTGAGTGDPLPGWVGNPALAELWRRVRDRFEAGGLAAAGRTVVPLASREERHAVGELLGVPQTGARVSVDLSVLDQRLRDRSGIGGLHDVLPLVTGGPVQDRPARRRAEAAAREGPLELARTLVAQPWADEWVAGLRRSGLLTRQADAERLVRDAARVLSALVGSDRPAARPRVELAAALLGDAHALDQDRPLHQVVLRGLAAARGQPAPVTAEDRRILWAAYDVAPDLLSRACLVVGLAPDGTDPAARRLQLAAGAGDPVHLTEWDLRRTAAGSWSPAVPVLVCENPRVLEAVAERHGPRQPVVCTSGEPNTVVTAVLGRLVDAGAHLLYHGDFDWPGLTIANRLVDRYGVEPWLMSAGDYERSARPDAPALTGAPVESVWDAELGSAMRAFGRALHEESVLPELLGAL